MWAEEDTVGWSGALNHFLLVLRSFSAHLETNPRFAWNMQDGRKEEKEGRSKGMKEITKKAQGEKGRSRGGGGGRSREMWFVLKKVCTRFIGETR